MVQCNVLGVPGLLYFKVLKSLVILGDAKSTYDQAICNNHNNQWPVRHFDKESI